MKVNAIRKTYNGRCVLDFPGMDFERGKIYSVIGANGSGKTTFARILSGIEKDDSKARPAEGLKIGYMPQKSYGFKMSVEKNICLNGKDETKAEELMREFDIYKLRRKNGAKLSGGETAKMSLCRMMMGTYDIVILDEPCASMDVESTLCSEKLIRKYCEQTNCALILITHSMRQAKELSDEILFFSDGKLEPIDSAKGKAFVEYLG